MIHVDPRTGSGHLVPRFKKLGVPAMLTPQEFGDGVFLGDGPRGVVHVGIEWKTVEDLIASLTNGRLSGHQLPGLLECYDHVWLVIIGGYRPSKPDGILEIFHHGRWLPARVGRGSARRPWMYRDIEGYLTTLQVQCGVRVRHVFDEDELVRFVATLYRWWEKPWSEHSSTHMFRQIEDPIAAIVHKHLLIRRVAKELPGIGWKHSAKVAQTFQTVRRMVNADPEEWRRITDKNGRALGQKTIDKIQHAMDPVGERRGPRKPVTRSRRT